MRARAVYCVAVAVGVWATEKLSCVVAVVVVGVRVVTASRTYVRVVDRMGASCLDLVVPRRSPEPHVLRCIATSGPPTDQDIWLISARASIQTGYRLTSVQTEQLVRQHKCVRL